MASNIEGYANVVADGVDGLLVPPKDTRKLAQTLISLMSDESLRQQMGAKGLLKAREHSWEHIAQRVLSYYTRILSEPPWNQSCTEGKNLSPPVQQKDGR